MLKILDAIESMLGTLDDPPTDLNNNQSNNQTRQGNPASQQHKASQPNHEHRRSPYLQRSSRERAGCSDGGRSPAPDVRSSKERIEEIFQKLDRVGQVECQPSSGGIRP